MGAQKSAVEQELVFLHEIAVERKPSTEDNFVFVDHSPHSSSTSRRGKQGGGFTVRSYVSRRSKREKREQKGLEKNGNPRVIPVSLAP